MDVNVQVSVHSVHYFVSGSVKILVFHLWLTVESRKDHAQGQKKEKQAVISAIHYPDPAHAYKKMG